MSNKGKKGTVLVIVGPTAVGKTDLSIQLAKKVNGEIISADSRLFYNGMDIGTAKPTKAQMDKVPHHLIDCAEPKEIWSLAVFREKANECIRDILERGKTPILVGGTGQYIRAVTEGWVIPSHQPDERLREILQRWADEIGGQALYDKLAIVDPEAAGNIDPTNVRRTIRALEVIFFTGKKFSEQRQKTEPEFEFWIIGLNRSRSELYANIDLRIETMFEQGLIEETKKLIEIGMTPEDSNLSAIGYREVYEYVTGKISKEEAKRRMKKKTREFVRRQRNWFKPDDPQIHWYEVKANLVDEIYNDLRVANILR